MAGYNEGDGKITIFIDSASGTSTDNLAQITFGVRDIAGTDALEPDAADLGAVVAALNETDNLWDRFVWDQVSMVGVRFDGYDGYVVEDTFSSPIPGGIDPNTSTQAVLGSPAAVVVQKRCVQRGRRYRGRFFLPSVVMNFASVRSGLIDTTTLAALNESAEDTFTAMNVYLATWPVAAQLALVSPAPEVGPAFPSRALSGFTVNGTVGVQRRRLGRG